MVTTNVGGQSVKKILLKFLKKLKITNKKYKEDPGDVVTSPLIWRTSCTECSGRSVMET